MLLAKVRIRARRHKAGDHRTVRSWPGRRGPRGARGPVARL